jgi:PadR family transcriptional regulator, regulatory protein PadR
MSPSGEGPRADLLPGTLEIIVLRALTSMGPQHAYGIAARIEQVAEQAIRLNQGTLYPALVRLEQKGWIKGTWRTTENNRDAKYYAITRAGGRALADQAAWWERSAALVNRLLADGGE